MKEGGFVVYNDRMAHGFEIGEEFCPKKDPSKLSGYGSE
jgi:hypothetical protein